MALNVLLEATPLDNGTPTTIRMSSAAVLSSGTHLDGVEWLPVITSAPTPSFSISSGGGAASAMTISMGGVSFRIGKRYGNRDWNTLSWVGAPVTMWVGDARKPFSEYRQFFSGTLSGLARTQGIAELALRTVEGQLDVPLLSRRYAGTGGPEGPAGKKGQLKPFCIGDTRIVAAVEVDPALLVYQVHGYGPVRDIPNVYEFGQALAPSKGDAADFAALSTAELKPGEWITCRALGMFRLGGRPDKKLTADVLGAGHDGTNPTLVSTALPLLLREAGVSPQRIGDMSALDFSWCFYATQQTTIAEVAQKAALDAGAYLFPDRTGIWCCGRHRAEKPARDLRVDRTSEPLVRTISELNVADPTWKVEVAYDPCWSVHDESDISPKLIELEGKINARDEVLDELIDEAEQAAADAAFARTEMATMLADGILDRPEKRRAIDHLERQRTQHRRLEGVHGAYSVQVQWDAYDAAWKAAEAYMLALAPSIYDDATNTLVDKAAYLAVWATYDAALKALFDTIIGRTVGVPGKAPIGGVIAPDGTITGGRPAQDVLGDVDASKNALKKLPDLVGPLLQKPIDDLAALHITYGASQLKAATALNKKNLVAIQEIGTRVEEDGSKVAESILNLTSRVTEAEAAVAGIDVDGPIEAGLLEIRKTIANANYASVEAVDIKIANYGKGVSAWQVEEERIRVEQGKALAEDIDAMGVRITTEVDGVKETMEGAFNDLRQLIVDSSDNSALALRVDELGVRITDEVGDEKKAREAAVQDIQKAYADADKALAERSETISSSVDKITAADGPIESIKGVIQTLQKTQADDNGARAEETKKVVSRLDNLNGVTGASVEQAIKTAVDAAGKAGASYVLKVQTDQNGQRYIAGFGVAIEDGVSSMTVAVDSFRLITPGTNPIQLFYADADGGVYMPKARVDKISIGAMDGEFNANKQTFNGVEGTQMLPGGVVMKWGKYRGGIFDEGVVTVTFVTPFPNSCDAFVPTPYLATFNTARDLWIQNIGEPSRYGASVGAQAATRNDQRIDGFDWIAFGR